MKSINENGNLSVDFIEFLTDKPEILQNLFIKMGFEYRGEIISQSISVFSQQEIIFLLHRVTTGPSLEFFKKHGTSISSIGLRTAHPELLIERATAFGYEAISDKNATLKNFSGIVGVGGSLIYLTGQKDSLHNFITHKIMGENYSDKSCMTDSPLTSIDHIAMNVFQGETTEWEAFFKNIFGFAEIDDFEINGHYTRFSTKAFGHASSGLKIVISESDDERSQINEYLRVYNGPGIQHLAFNSKDIYKSVAYLSNNKIDFMSIPETYYQKINKRLPFQEEDVKELQSHHILIDGKSKNEILLQIFTKTLIGPIFFEVIQRKGNEGFGAGNITALFESVEQDQLARKTITEDHHA